MASDFDRLEAMLAMVPISRLQCPKCNAHGEDDFELLYMLSFVSPLSFDGPAKLITVDYEFEKLERIIEEVVRCMCGHEFELPEGWKISNSSNKRAKKKPPVETQVGQLAPLEKDERVQKWNDAYNKAYTSEKYPIQKKG